MFTRGADILETQLEGNKDSTILCEENPTSEYKTNTPYAAGNI